MKILNKFIALILLASCGSKDSYDPPNNHKVEVTEAVNTLKTLIRFDSVDGFVSEYSNREKDTGDSTLRNGQLCFAGFSEYCQFVKNAIAEDGKIFRAPSRVGSDEDNAASRDQLTGVIMYLVKTHDTTTATKVMNYIQDHDGYMCEGDTRCKVSNIGIGGMWGLLRITWNHLGLKPTPMMIVSNVGDETTLLVESKSTPLNYRSYLIALQILVYIHCDKYTTKLSDAAENLYKRDNKNPLYGFITSNENGVKNFLKLYPRTVGIRDSWSIQNDMSKYDTSKDNIGSWLFMGGLILNGVK
jgi:hypothetical protein